MKNLGFLSLLVLLVFASCRKDTEVVNVTEEPENPIITVIDDWQPRIDNVTGDLAGYVVDENLEPMSGATATLNGQTTTTDVHGHFFFTDVEMNKLGTYVKIEKDGYFLGSRRFFPADNSKNRVAVEMLPYNFIQDFNSDQAGNVQLGDVNVSFPAGSVSDAAGEYTGIVRVSAHYLDPSDPNVYTRMPGNLQGVSSAAEEVALKTAGMLALELTGAGGEKLNIKEGQTATISMQLSNELLANAPATIPLWSFDEERGMWIEEGTATLENGAYVGQVSHFSFWNCDIPTEYVDFGVTIQDADGNPVTFTTVTIISDVWGSAYGITDNTGYTGGIVPANETLTLEILSSCYDVLYTQQVGPFSDNTDLGVITVDVPTINSTTISGSIVDCDNNPVSNGMVLVSGEGINQYIYLGNGVFDEIISTCVNPSNVTLTAYDLDNLIQSVPQDIIIGIANNLGAVSACDEVIEDNLFTLTVTEGGEITTATYLGVTAQSSQTGTGLVLDGDNVAFYIFFGGNTAGDYSGSEQNFIEVMMDQNNNWNLYTQNQAGIENLVITEYSDNVVGTLSGNMINGNSGETVYVEGVFNVPVE